jgi:uncharacterized phiE125 gp8 family phage protein
MSLTLVTAPTVEPLTLIDAKVHLREPLDVSDNDALIDTLIKAARQYAETFTRRAFLTQTWDWKLDAFPCDAYALQPPIANVTSITSITYTATDGTSTVWSSALYTTDLPVGPNAPFARIVPAYGQSYPATRDVINAVTVRFVAGYGASAKSVPESIKAAMKLLIGHWFMAREAVLVGVGIAAIEVPTTAESLLWPYRVW